MYKMGEKTIRFSDWTLEYLHELKRKFKFKSIEELLKALIERIKKSIEKGKFVLSNKLREEK